MRINQSVIIAFGFAVLIASLVGTAAKAASPQAYFISGYGKSAATMNLTPTDGVTPITLRVDDPKLRAEFLDANVGDTVLATVGDNPPAEILAITQITHPVSGGLRIMALAGPFALLLLGAAAVTNWRPQQFLIGVDNRFSNSQCQAAFWFSALATAYAATLILRVSAFGLGYLGGVGIPQNLAALTGLSALSFGAAKVITVSKLNPPPNAASPAVASRVKSPALRANFIRDLVSNDRGGADFGDFQMMLITGAAVTIFIGQSFHFLGQIALVPPVTLPEVDTTLLASFGIGQGAYLIKKGASNPGDG
jgi:hypothetical protein